MVQCSWKRGCDMLDNKICILIIDDEKRMAQGLEMFFASKGYEVMTAFDGQEGLDIYYAHNAKIDLILLDVMMPIMTGIEVLKELRDNQDLVPVIMLTAKSEEYDQLEGFNLGADDYVCKPFLPSLLQARIDSVLKRSLKGVREDKMIGNVTISQVKSCVYVGEVDIELTRREFELIQYLELNKGMALSREQILNGVWGYDFDGDIRTVDTHIKQLRIKLGEQATLIKTVHRVGYMMEDKNEN